MPARNLFVLIGCLLAGVAAWLARSRDLPGDRFNEAVSIITSSALEPVSARQLFESAIDGAISELDEHSAYIRQDEQEGFEALIDQQFGGVGLELAHDETTGDLCVVSPVPSGPAWQAGVVAGDRILAIDGLPTRGLALGDVVTRLRGQIGTPVLLRVAAARPTPVPTTVPTSGEDPSDAGRDVRLTRALVTTETVLGDRRGTDGAWSFRLADAADIALVRINGFGERTVEEFEAALAAIASPPPRGIVLDLRGNPGGLVSAAVGVCDRLLESGVIVSTRGRAGAAGDPPLEVREATAGAAFPDVPVAVIIDGLTASAAEIVAACLQDHGRATVVGSRTFGKGTVQSLVPLGGGDGLLKLTTSEYLRPRGAGLNRRMSDDDDAQWGVAPDRGYEISPTAASLERLRRWRRQRDAVAAPGRDTGTESSRSVDEALSLAIDAVHRGSAARAELGRQKEAARDADDALSAGE